MGMGLQGAGRPHCGHDHVRGHACDGGGPYPVRGVVQGSWRGPGREGWSLTR